MTQVPAAQAAGRTWLRLGRYVTYLPISRQRRSARWWRATAAGAWLVPWPGQAPGYALLRLLTCQQTGRPEEAS